MPVTAFVNRKGGVAKSTSVASVAAALARRLPKKEKPILVIDLDTQAHAGRLFGVYKGKGPDIGHVLYEGLPVREAVRETLVERIHVLPGSEALGTFDLDVAELEGREQVIARMLAPLREEYSHILIDCPPGLGLIHTNVYAAADYVIVPLEPESFAVDGLQTLEQNLQDARAGIGASVRLLGALVTQYDRRTREHRDNNLELREYYQDRVFRAFVRIDTKVREAARAGLTVFEYDAGTHAAKDYDAVAREMLARIKQDRQNGAGGEA